MNYLIDTNICIYLMNRRPQYLVQKLRLFLFESLKISSITVAELQYGVAKSQRTQHNQTRLDEFLLPFEVLPFGNEHTQTYGEIRASLAQKGQIIGPLDMLIAAHALTENLTLVTNNDKEFKRVKGLNVENWVTQ
jgi:tRNA(fMet)-specific endonuclease VapC